MTSLELVHDEDGPIITSPFKEWSWTVEEITRVSGVVSETEEQIDDAIYTVQPSETTVREFEVFLNVTPPVDPSRILIENLTPEIATFADGKATYVSDGIAKIRITIEDTARIISHPVELIVEGGEKVWNRWVTGTFAAANEDEIRSAIAGKTADDMALFTSLESRIRNPNNWLFAAGYDVSCISLSVPNTLPLAKDFGVQAKHFTTGSILWQAMDGTLYPRTVLDYYDVEGADLRFVKFDPLPDDIVLPLLAPAEIESWTPTTSKGVLGIRLDQEKKTLLGRLRAHVGSIIAFGHPGDDLAEFYEPIVGGDSGSNGFLLHVPSKRLIALTGWTFGQGGSGPGYDEYLSELAAAHTALGCVGAYEIADLSAFPTF